MAPTNQIEASLGKVRFEGQRSNAVECQHDDDIVSCLQLDNNTFRSARSLPSLVHSAVHDALIPPAGPPTTYDPSIPSAAEEPLVKQISRTRPIAHPYFLHDNQIVSWPR
jgi:hypothetical protein